MTDGVRRDFFKLGGLIGALGLAGQAQRAKADDNEKDDGKKSHTVAGSWTVQITYDNTPNNSGSQGTKKTAMCQFHDDGRWVGSVSAVDQGSQENWPLSWRQATYHGEWKSQDKAVVIQAKRLRYDDSGHIVAIATTTINAVLDATGSKWSGNFTTLGVTTGVVLTETFTGKLDAQRM